MNNIAKTVAFTAVTTAVIMTKTIRTKRAHKDADVLEFVTFKNNVGGTTTCSTEFLPMIIHTLDHVK